MAEFSPLLLTVEFDKDKVDALNKAVEKMDEAHRASRESIIEARDALYDLQRSMTVRREIS